MSQENVEIVRSVFEALGRNDFEGWLATASAEIKLYPRREEPGVKDRYEGLDGVLEYLANWYSGWEDYKVKPERFINAGEYIVVDVREAASPSRVDCELRRTSPTRSRSATARSWSGECSVRWTKPAKPSGCRSRRCRRRTWIGCRRKGAV